MHSIRMKFALVIALVVVTSWASSSVRVVAQAGQGLTLASIGPLAFGPDGTLFAADNQDAAIFALDLGAQASGGAPGAKGLDALDEKLAALLGTGAREITITDLAVHPRTRNAYVSVMRGQGAGAAPALFRIDGAGKIDHRVAAVAQVPAASSCRTRRPPTRRAAQNPRASVITDMAFADGRLWVAGLSNEEFASKLRAIPYPFASVDGGTSVEIYHGNHRQLETRSPVNAFVPYTLNNQPHLLAGYTCTPLVKFPIADLKPGEKVRGTTIAEFGAGNRVLDMIVYRKGGQEFLLTANNSRGVMKIPTSTFATAAPITTPVETETGGVPFEKVTSMTGIEQLDKLDEQNSIVIARAGVGLVEPAGRSASVRFLPRHAGAPGPGRGADGLARRHRFCCTPPAAVRPTLRRLPPSRSRHHRTAETAYVEVTGLPARRCARSTCRSHAGAVVRHPSRGRGGRRAGDARRLRVADGALRFTPLVSASMRAAVPGPLRPGRLPGAPADAGGVVEGAVGRPASATDAFHRRRARLSERRRGSGKPAADVHRVLGPDGPEERRRAHEAARRRGQRDSRRRPAARLRVLEPRSHAVHGLLRSGPREERHPAEQQMGRPLETGRSMTLVISREWRDEHGLPLKEDFSRTFRVGPPEEKPLDTASWRIQPPAAGTRDGVVVTFPKPLDHGLLMRALGVTRDGQPVEGDIAVEQARRGGRSRRPSPGARAPTSCSRSTSSRIRPAIRSAARSR